MRSRKRERDRVNLVWTWVLALLAAIFFHTEVYAVESQSQEISDKLNRQIFWNPSQYTDIKLFTNNTDAFKGKLDMIGQAKSKIDIVYFIWEEDYTSSLFMQKLMSRADEGIKIRILVDYMETESQVDALLTLSNHLSGGRHNIEVKRFRPPSKRLVSLLKKDNIKVGEFLEGIMLVDKKKILEAVSGSTIFKDVTDFQSLKTRETTEVITFIVNLFIHRAPILANEFNNFLKRSHYKLLLVDGKKFMLGGRNISDQYHAEQTDPFLQKPTELNGPRYAFQDTDLEATEGPRTSNQSIQSEAFERLWIFEDSVSASDVTHYYDSKFDTQGQVLPPALPEATIFDRAWKTHVLGFDDGKFSSSTLEMPGPLKGEIFENAASDAYLTFPAVLQTQLSKLFWDWQGMLYNQIVLVRQIAHEYVNLINAAQNRIDIVTAYFYIDKGFIDKDFSAIYDALIRKAKSGVQVNVYTNSPLSTDLDIVNFVSYRNYDVLEQNNIHIHELAPDQGSLHTKVMTIDDNIMAVGSFNLDPRSQMYDTNDIIVLRDDSQILVRHFRQERGVDPSPNGLKWQIPLPEVIKTKMYHFDDENTKAAVDTVRNSI